MSSSEVVGLKNCCMKISSPAEVALGQWRGGTKSLLPGNELPARAGKAAVPGL